VTSPEDRTHDDDDEPRGGLVRRVLSYGPSVEDRLEQLLAQRRNELDEHAARLHESIAELERREELLRDSRASVERMLRLGTSELESRESELTSFVRELAEREAELARSEEELARRRQQLGAVELKRASVESRERAVSAREEELAELEATLAEREAALPRSGRGDVTVEVELVFVPGERYRVVEIATAELASGNTFELEGEAFVVARVGSSPLPGDPRRCAYLVRGP
jgi:chromosome segregation ATPase